MSGNDERREKVAYPKNLGCVHCGSKDVRITQKTQSYVSSNIFYTCNRCNKFGGRGRLRVKRRERE